MTDHDDCCAVIIGAGQFDLTAKPSPKRRGNLLRKTKAPV